jgi:hypothetical protein
MNLEIEDLASLSKPESSVKKWIKVKLTLATKTAEKVKNTKNLLLKSRQESEVAF